MVSMVKQCISRNFHVSIENIKCEKCEFFNSGMCSFWKEPTDKNSLCKQYRPDYSVVILEVDEA